MVDLSENYKMVQQMDLYSRQTSATLTYVSRLAQQVSPFIEKTISEVSKIQAIVSHIEKRKAWEKKAILESGWWLSPTIMELPARVMDGAIEKYVNGEKGAITDFFLSLFDHTELHNLNWMVEQWSSNDFFCDWKRPIDEAVNAYKNKQYFLTIPALLLITEGIATEFCKRNALKVEQSKGNDKIKNSIQLVENSGTYFPRSEILFRVLDSVIYADTRRAKACSQYFFNRHAVLHGLDHGYGTRENAVKAFLLLDVLAVLA